MDFTTIMQAVTTVGFPIVMTFILIYVIVNMARQHKEEIDTMRIALEQNTLALTKLLDRIEKEK